MRSRAKSVCTRDLYSLRESILRKGIHAREVARKVFIRVRFAFLAVIYFAKSVYAREFARKVFIHAIVFLVVIYLVKKVFAREVARMIFLVMRNRAKSVHVRAKSEIMISLCLIAR